MTRDDFYVYLLLDPLKGGKWKFGDFEFDFEPFYIGKGSGDRAFRHTKKILYDGCNPHKQNKIKKIIGFGKTPIVLFAFENLIEEVAFSMERELINTVGRSDLKKGPLTNKTEGGIGGHSGQIVSEKTKEKLRKANIGKQSPLKGMRLEEIHGDAKAKEIKEKVSLFAKGKKNIELYGFEKAEQMRINASIRLKGVVKNEEWRRNLSQSLKGRKLTIETRKKISDSLYGNNRAKGHIVPEWLKKKISDAHMGVCSWNAVTILQFDKDMNFIREWRSAHDAAKELKLSQGNIWSVLHGDRKSCGGYVWKLKQ
jgi:hypothetical protein